MDDLPLGLTPEGLIVLSSASAALIAVAALWIGLIQRDPMAAKARELAERRLKLKEAATSGRAKGQKENAVGFMRDVVSRLNLLRSKHAEGMSRKLARAGWRSNDAMVAYLFAKATLPICAAAIMAIYLLAG
ncbi:MAG: hypothetical protein HKM95_13900, partial [Inquilinus sp.]|nr:hypothetical protein [Inquilinus sp.]